MPYFRFEGQRIAYTQYGRVPADDAEGRRERAAESDRPLILLHGLLLSQEMHRPLAEDLAVRGNRVITIDLLGHGESDRPRDMWRYSMADFGEQVVALMDHLGLERAAVMGTSLGANAALEVAAHSPERLRGMVIEMPVLDNGLLGSALAFTPVLVSLTFGEPIMQGLARITRAIPRWLLPHYGNVILDLVRQDPGPGGALLQGLFSGMLAREMPNARLLEANSLIELRMQPDRLTNEIAGFLDELWSSSRASRNGRASTSTSTSTSEVPKHPTHAKQPKGAPAKRTASKRAAAKRGARGARRSAG
jgi:pimeloyl-ACP methyl ester carboxylesterase